MRGKDNKGSPPLTRIFPEFQKEHGYLLDIVVVRTIFALTLTGAAYVIKPFGFSGIYTIFLGLGCAVGIIYFEHRLKQATLKRLIGAACGSIMGIIGSVLISDLLTDTVFDTSTLSFIKLFVLFLMTYVGLVVGANKGDLLNLAALGGIFGGERPPKKAYKILDTSVIIDGRIADICETGFLDGILVIPHFVLRELQQVADSADSLKRNRGRRGLDILQRVQKMAGITVQFVENDYPQVREVDMKLIELAMEFEAKIVTNDFNLNKVAQLRGVEVLNINELANALKPVYLPGETMKVFILKEGKEFNQGIAYLDDGTMVVVDNARKMIGKTVESSVTSVLQTTAGKMIFGRYEEKRSDLAHHTMRGRIRGPKERNVRLKRRFPIKVAAIIAAAGAGRRMKSDRPKQLLVLDGTPILIYTLRKFDRCSVIDYIIVAAPRESVSEIQELVASGGIRKPVVVIQGGDRRQDSVAIAMEHLEPETTIVAVHDAVRPFVSLSEIESVVMEAERKGAAILVVPIVDTVKQVERDSVELTLAREHLVLAQTPQVFRTEVLKEAFAKAGKDEYYGTDESSLVERIGRPVAIVRGSERNIKITRPSDLTLAAVFLNEERSMQ